MTFFKLLRGASLQMTPLRDLRRAAQLAGCAEFVSEGEDPQFDIRPTAGFRSLRGGWYLLRGYFASCDEELVGPCLYADYGEGMSEATRIDLPPPDRSGRFRAVVVFPRRVRALRFDPAVNRARFRLGGLSLKRISRPRALVELLAGIGRASAGGRPWRRMREALAPFLSCALRGRLRLGADHLWRRYTEGHRSAESEYGRWLALFDRPAQAGGAAADIADLPTISVLVPVCDPPLPYLRRCLDSVLAQSYPNWQLCIADDASADPAVRALLHAYAARDPRIRLTVRTGRGHICRATNSALELATGDFVAFLDHDDELAPDALLEVSRAVAAHPKAHLIYTDEDKIDEAGERCMPHFKPGWNPDLLRSQNYVCHLMVVRTPLLRALGGMRPGYEGAQDHDLLLRCAERLAADEVVHIPRVLYHWRMLPGSTAMGAAHKGYALEAGRRALEAHLARTGVSGEVGTLDNGYYRIVRPLPPEPPEVTIVIPTRDRVDLLRTCLDSVRSRTVYPRYRLLIVDNGSTDADTVDYLRGLAASGYARVLCCPAPFNFSDLVNRGVRSTRSPLVCLLNNDIEVLTPEWLDELVAHALREEVGVVGAKLYYPDHTVQHAGVILGIGGVAGHVHCGLPRGASGYMGRAGITQNLSAVTGACMVFRREVFDRVGGFDDALPVAFNDIDFCIRVMRAGYRNVWTPHAELVHHESASRGLEDTPEKRARFKLEAELMRRRWAALLDADPAYNPNLAVDATPFSLACPPRSRSSRHGGFPDLESAPLVEMEYHRVVEAPDRELSAA